MSSRAQASTDDLSFAPRRAGGEVIGREQVLDIQRARMLAAMIDVTAELGAGNITVAQVVARAGLSRRTFYEMFQDLGECFLAAFDDAIEELAAHVIPCYEREDKWREKMRAGLIALLEFLEDERGLGRLVIVETLGAGPDALDRRQRVLGHVITVVDRGRREAKRVDSSPPLAAEGTVGAVLSIIHNRMVAPDLQPLADLVNPLMAMIVLPYLGPVAARRELDRPAPAHNAKRSGENPLKGLEIRLTYRTVRVLMAIGAQPGVSNRLVGEDAGISDQGQTSKLLARLQRLGLIENAGFGRGRGESNSWHLTPRGHGIEQAIRERTGRH